MKNTLTEERSEAQARRVRPPKHLASPVCLADEQIAFFYGPSHD